MSCEKCCENVLAADNNPGQGFFRCVDCGATYVREGKGFREFRASDSREDQPELVLVNS